MLLSTVYAQDTLRIMTININQGADTSLQAIANFIREVQPDIVALQELDMWPNRWYAPAQRNRNFIAELSYYTDMMGYFGKAYDHPEGWDYGDGLLVRYPVTRVETYELPYNTSLRGSEPREMIVAHISVGGHDISFASTHLCHMDSMNRVKQMKAVKQIMQRQKEKIRIVCGDLNSDPRERIVSRVMNQWYDVLPAKKTFPSNGKPYAKYDYILLEKKAKIQVADTFFLCNDDITDHCACVADIVLPCKKVNNK